MQSENKSTPPFSSPYQGGKGVRGGKEAGGGLILRLAIAIILLMHSVPQLFNNGINDFGNHYLNAIGFAPMGVAIAWAIKLSHIVSAICLLINRYVVAASIITIIVLVMGIIMVHGPEGWFVVGAGRNGIEFNFLMIAVLLTFIIQRGFRRKNQV